MKKTMEITKNIALAGNPNSGKTTLFNALTGSKAHVGNWPGVTVEKKEGRLKAAQEINLVDLPGIYSLSPISADEIVAHEYLENEKIDLVINILDSTNLRRNLYLTTQLIEHCDKILIALNMQDELTQKGKYIDCAQLEKQLGCKCVSISAGKGVGIEQIEEYCKQDDYLVAKPIELTANSVVQEAEQRYALIDKILEKVICTTQNAQEKDIADNVDNSDGEKGNSEFSLQNKEKVAVASPKMPQEQPSVNLLTSSRIKKDGVISQISARSERADVAEESKRTLSEKIDAVVTNKWLAFPIFALVMLAVFFLSIDGLGGLLTNLINENLSPLLMETVRGWLSAAPQWLSGLVVDGIMAGVLAVVGFAPQIMLLFGLISCLEASGYMSRIVFIMDKLLRKIGLSGKSFVSLVVGCGCSVPAIMATRTIKNQNERRNTITLCPMIPCSAKIALFSFFTSTMFGGNALYAASMYFLSIFAIILGGLVLKIFNKKGAEQDVFIVELPPYRMPKAKTVLKDMWEKGKSFLGKAGTVIFTASVVLWLLTTFDVRFNMVEGENSILATIGKFFAPLFVPLGFGEWEFAVATLSGLAAKETVVSTIEILTGGAQLSAILTPLSAYSFMTFNLLCAPCMATIGASFRELGKARYGWFALAFQTVFAYVFALIIYQVGSLAVNHTAAFVTALTIIIVAVVLALCIVWLTRKKGCGCKCGNCPYAGNCKKKGNKEEIDLLNIQK